MRAPRPGRRCRRPCPSRHRTSPRPSAPRPRRASVGPIAAQLIKIVSGGQTGADRGALDAAIARGVDHGGWCPKGRLAEDGRIPPRYMLRETSSASYAHRTRKNVQDSDATLLVTRGAPVGGSALTAKLARQLDKPLLHIDLDAASLDEAATRARIWIAAESVSVLNVAGPRASGCPGIGDDVARLVARILQ